MTFVIPNDFIDSHPEWLISSSQLFCALYSERSGEDNLSVRTTTHMINVIQEGKKILHHEGHSFTLGNSDLIVIPQGNYFMSNINSEVGFYRSLIFFIDDAFLRDFIIKHDLQPLDSTPSSKPYQLKQTPAIRQLCDSIACYHQEKIIQKRQLLQLKTEELLLNLLSQNPEATQAFIQGSLASSNRRLLSILESNLDILESANDMVKISRLPASRLRKEMLELTGMAPKQWLLSKKLEQAALLLCNTNQPIKEIATSCSFATPSWFANQFKTHYGITPNDYRAQNR